MSVRLFKIGIIVFLLHAVLLTLIWVGFSVPSPSASAVFIYGGATSQTGPMMSEDQATASNAAPQSVVFDPFDASFFQPWVSLRAIEKPKARP